MTTPYDLAIASQRAAADPQSSVFVRANAGSGKTKVLVDRIARLLLDGFEPSAFLCITYTKAAAAEMQRRLFERLGQWCVADDAALTKSLTDLRGHAPRDGELARARTLFARALETPGGLRIQTIHAFCERLLGRFPIEAGIAPGFEIADETKQSALLAQAWSAAAAQAMDAAVHFATRLDSERLDKFRAALVRRREDIAALGGTGPIDAESLRRRHAAPADRAAFISETLASTRWSALKDVADALDDHKTAQRLRAAIHADDEAKKLEAWLHAFLTDERTPRKQLFTKKHAKDHPWIEPVLLDECDRATAAFETLRAIDRAEDAIAAAALAHALAGAYETAKSHAGVLDFDDLISASRRLLNESGASAWVLYKLDGGVDHILVDEGQDTSPGQWALIAPLQDEFFSGETRRDAPRTVFAVGDAKQSIYSFQGADPERFDAESRRLSARAHAAGKPFTAPDLLMSFRSTLQVLNVVDAVFKVSPIGGAQPAASDEIVHTAWREKDTGCVEWWPLAPVPDDTTPIPWDAPRDLETAQSSTAALGMALAARVKAMIAAGEAVYDEDDKAPRPMRAGDVLILVRSRGTVFRAIIKAFKQAGLPVAGADRMVLREEPAVEDMLALLRVILDPTDDLALCVLLKSPLIGLTDDDADIYPLAYGRAKGDSVWARLCAAEDPKYAYARAFVADMIGRAADPPYETLAAALEGVDPQGRSGWRRMMERLGPEARDPLEELLSRALECARNGPATVLHLTAAIEADETPIKREMEHGGGSVRIMTVHGAKGLEAPVVLLPDTTGGPDSGGKDILFLDDHGPIVSTSRSGDDAVATAARQEAARRASAEHRRLLYVALTRARDRMIVCGHRSKRGTGDAHAESWHTLVEAGMREAGAVAAETPFGEGLRFGAPLIAEARDVEPAVETPRPAWMDRPAPDEGVKARSAAPSQLGHSAVRLVRLDAERRFQRGRLIHGLLERLPDAPALKRRALARIWLGPQGATGADAEALIDEAMAVLEHPDFAAAFGPGSRAEAPIAGVAPGLPPGGVRGSVDRLLVTPDKVLIVDFKTDRPAPDDPGKAPFGYIMQLAAYRAVLAQAFPGRTVRCALIWTETPKLMPVPADLLDLALARLGQAPPMS
ncbi:MAG: double-strand break repair helicase AddA [Alphaproteobacteria bacterium]|nr:double-strand break repair helicase AddA [Alphaproteobacteria bacterium]